jgi:hypothetical protein
MAAAPSGMHRCWRCTSGLASRSRCPRRDPEVVRGFALALAGDRPIVARFRWLGLLLADPLAEVVPFGSTAATLAGRLLAVAPHPPTGRRRDGTRARQRAAWALDVQIAACAFAGGYGVVTENVDDFAVLRDEISRLVPDVPPLVVRDAREPAETPSQPATGATTGPSTRSV